MKYQNILKTIGTTPLVKINKLVKNPKVSLYSKIEFFNPGGSVKDRIALSMTERAEKEGKLKRGMTIIEPTSGNTGIGLAMVAAVKGYKVILVMPETMSVERRKLLSAFGAEIVLTEGTKGMKGAVEKAKEMARTDKSFFMPMQFDNLVNPEVHYQTTGPEIWKDTKGKIDFLVAGVGTGGTLTGVGKYLKEKNPELKVVAIEPKKSPVLSGGKPGPHKIQGIGAGFIPSILDVKVIDEIITVEDTDATETARNLARKEGILAGISSGAAIWGALKLSQREYADPVTIVTVLPDTGERYLSMELY